MIKAITGCPFHGRQVGNLRSTSARWATSHRQCATCGAMNRFRTSASSLAMPGSLCRDPGIRLPADEYRDRHGEATRLRDWLTESDQWLNPQAAIISPAATCRIAEAIVTASSDYERTIAAGKAAVQLLKRRLGGKKLALSRKRGELARE